MADMVRVHAALLIGLLGVAGACGDDDSSGPTEIAFCVGSYDVAAFRLAGGAWERAVPDATGKHSLLVEADYEYAMVTVDTQYVFAWVTRSTATDVRAARAAQGGVREEVDCSTLPDATVTGSLAQPGTVTMNSSSATLNAPGNYNLSVRPGMHDLVATTGLGTTAGGSVAIRRDQMVTANTSLPLLDIVAEGAPLVATPMSVIGATSPSTSVYLVVDGNEYAEVSRRSGADPVAYVVPSGMLEPTDQQVIYVTSTLAGADVKFKGTVPALTLLPPLTGFTFTAGPVVSAAWSSVPVDDYSYVQMSINGETATGVLAFQYVSATSNWIDINGATSIGIDTAFPDFQSAWQLDTTKSYNANVSVYATTGDVSLWTSASTSSP